MRQNARPGDVGERPEADYVGGARRGFDMGNKVIGGRTVVGG